MSDKLKHVLALGCHAYLLVRNSLLLHHCITLLQSKILVRKLQQLVENLKNSYPLSVTKQIDIATQIEHLNVGNHNHY